MADQKISQLTELTSPSGSDVLPIVNNSETKKITVTNLLSGSNIQPYFISTDTGSAQNYQVGDNVWLGDVGMLNTLLIKGINESGSAYIKFGDSNGAHQHPYLGHDTGEDSNVLSIYADTTKITGSVIVGNGTLQVEPEMLHVIGSDSFNIARLIGNKDSYSQVYIQNLSSGSTASSDIVLTADNGNENELYINLGINSSNYNEAFNIGQQNDGYLLMNGQDLFVGTIKGGPTHGHVHIFASSSLSPEISVLTNNQVGFNTSGVTSGFTYEFSGSVKLNNDLNVNGSITALGKIGYESGGTATQSSLGQSVTINELTGKVTMASKSWSPGDTEPFIINCNKISDGDFVLAQVVDSANSTMFNVTAYKFSALPNMIQVLVRSIDSITESVIIQFFILKAPTS